MREQLIQVMYLGAAVLFILGLRGLTSPSSARRGMLFAEIGMLLAIVGTLLNHEIVRYEWIIVGLVLGSAIGIPIAVWMPMTAVPQRTALSHMFGALAATLVGISEYSRLSGHVPRIEMAALGFEVLLGSLTVTGSFLAFSKLQGLIRSAPITYHLQNLANLALMLLAAGLLVSLIVHPEQQQAFYLMAGLGLLIGVLIVLPIGGADMPVVMSLLNSYAGLAASATGFVLENNVLIVAGALDGASGFILSVLMSKAMNRSFANVLFGAFGGKTEPSNEITGAADRQVRSVSAEDAAIQLAYASSVVVVPGYGMAVAQAQHQVRELADLIEKRGGSVKFAIHPVAGRMPGHMNVLLAEANVPYDKLCDIDDINSEFERTDVVLVIGANDVVNPAARTDPSSPIYGMPILNADQARNIIVMKRSMAPGFAGVENELFVNPKTAMLFGDARDSLLKLISEIKTV